MLGVPEVRKGIADGYKIFVLAIKYYRKILTTARKPKKKA